MRNALLAALLTLLSPFQTASANPMQQVTLEPITHIDAALVVVSADGTETTYAPADLEGFATYSLTTATPWREEPATFEGVLLNDILAANGLADGYSITVTAENDYSTVLTDTLLETVDILVATRVNGLPHNRRDRGPIQFVIDQDVFQSSDLTSESNFVWMAARIEPQD